jgi:hypothetical protein
MAVNGLRCKKLLNKTNYKSISPFCASFFEASLHMHLLYSKVECEFENYMPHLCFLDITAT